MWFLPRLERKKEEKHLNRYTKELLDKKVSPRNSLNTYFMSSVSQIKSKQMDFKGGEIKRKALDFSVGLVTRLDRGVQKLF